MHEDGFASVTPLAAARERLRELCAPHGRAEYCATANAAGCVLATAVDADRAVPHYDRAAMDGFAVRAEDTFDASGRSPVRLRVVGDPAGADGDGAETVDRTVDTDPSIGAGEAAQVHTGSAMPDGADAVVKVERTERRDGDVLVSDAVTVGEHVGPAGEDVEAGQRLFETGRRLRPTDLALLRSTGRNAVEVVERPEVRVLPTGEELVAADEIPDPGQVVETNGLLVASLVEEWGGVPEYDDVVTDDATALRDAIESGADDCDLVVTTGGSSVGERDLVPEVVDDAGSMVVHGLAIKPGHPAGFGVVGDTLASERQRASEGSSDERSESDGAPVLVLPGYPVSCLVTAVQLLRPALAFLAGTEPEPLSTARARLGEKLPSAPGERTFARVGIRDVEGANEGPPDETGGPEPGDAGGGASECADDGALPVVEPLRTSGAGVLSSVAYADGWVVVPESSEGLPAGETVTVEAWEACAPPASAGRQ